MNREESYALRATRELGSPPSSVAGEGSIDRLVRFDRI